MKEPDVTITDYLLASEALAFAVMIARSPGGSPLPRWFAIFFAATAAASLAGGTVHGFLPDSKPLWRIVLVSLGVVTVAAWAIGAHVMFSDRIARLVTIAAWVEFGVYALSVASGRDVFRIAVLNYLPSTLFLMIAFVTAYRATTAPPIAWGLGGLLLTFVAAGVQQARVAIHPTYFNHNALYHAVQVVALFLIFRAATFLTAP